MANRLKPKIDRYLSNKSTTCARRLNMRSTLVYDIPTRLFHWLFSGLFLFSFVIAKTTDDESVVFVYHMLSGLLLGALILWRIVWGVVGSEHARFTNFNLNPIALKDYFLGLMSGSKKRWAGHNPASSWAAITMLALGLGLATTGYLMTTGNKDVFEDIHELMANAFIVIVGLHITGVVFHTIRHKDGVGFSMLDGKKELSDGTQPIPSSRGFAGLFLLALVLSAGLYLYKNFNSNSNSLTVFGQTLQLGENEGGGDQAGEVENKSDNNNSSEGSSEADDD